MVRSLNGAGVDRFRAYLARLREGSTAEPPRALLEDPRYTAEIPVEIVVERAQFDSRQDMAAYLVDMLMRLPAGHADAAEGMWTWLSLFWFDQLCPLRADGTRRPGAEYRHIARLGHKRYRHLVYGPYGVVRRHGSASRVLLSGPPNLDSHIYNAITGVQDLIANRSVLEAASLLYLDPATGRLKPGCQSAARSGAIRRFVRVLQQLDLTYDIFGMSGEDILEILPAEFDAWRPQASLAGLDA